MNRFYDAFSHFTADGYTPPNWVFDINHQHVLSPTQARVINNSNIINNTSRLIILTFAGIKVIYTGDIQKEAWLYHLNNQSFVEAALDPSCVIAPHHGHRSSYCADLYSKIGKPLLNICSLASNDQHIASEYSTDTTSVGCELYGSFRRMLSTRSDGTIIIDINESSCTVSFADLDNNDY